MSCRHEGYIFLLLKNFTFYSRDVRIVSPGDLVSGLLSQSSRLRLWLHPTIFSSFPVFGCIHCFSHYCFQRQQLYIKSHCSIIKGSVSLLKVSYPTTPEQYLQGFLYFFPFQYFHCLYHSLFCYVVILQWIVIIVCLLSYYFRFSGALLSADKSSGCQIICHHYGMASLSCFKAAADHHLSKARQAIDRHSMTCMFILKLLKKIGTLSFP